MKGMLAGEQPVRTYVILGYPSLGTSLREITYS